MYGVWVGGGVGRENTKTDNNLEMFTRTQYQDQTKSRTCILLYSVDTNCRKDMYMYY